MLDDFLNEAKEVVQARQARPGVAVHVRLGGGNSMCDQEYNEGNATDTAGSYAVWAVTVGRDACGVVRVACSEMAQTEVPRSAVQRVQVCSIGCIARTVCRPRRNSLDLVGSIVSWTNRPCRIR